MKLNRKEIFHDIVFTSLVLIISTIIPYIFFHRIGLTYQNVDIVYVLVLILIARSTHGYIYGVVASTLCVLSMKFLFFNHTYAFNIVNSHYPLTYPGFLIIFLLASILTSHVKIQSAQLAQRDDLLQKAEKEKMRANLLRAVSHDLRTPLTTIIGSTNSLIENSGSYTEEEKIKLLQNISEDSNWLLHMVENLLTITRISGSSTKVKKSLEAVEEVVSEAVMRLQKRLPNAKVNVHVPNEFILLPMDPLLIEQVIINLLENAFIHGKSSIPTDLIIENDDAYVSFHVRDYGVGIDSDQLPTIFDGSAGRSSNSVDGHRGIGIGMSICKTIIEAHNGTLMVISHENGAEFIFKLPKSKENEF